MPHPRPDLPVIYIAGPYRADSEYQVRQMGSVSRLFSEREIAMNETLSELIAFLKEVSPLVWSTLIKQVYVEAISFLVWAIGLSVACVAFVYIARFAKAKKEEEGYLSNWELLYGSCYPAAVISGIIAFGFIVDSVKWFVNPEFYAIRFVIQSITGGG